MADEEESLNKVSFGAIVLVWVVEMYIAFHFKCAGKVYIRS